MPNDLSNSTWSPTDASNTTASPNGWPTGITGAGAVNTGRQMMGAQKRSWERVNPTVTSGGSANAYTYTPVNTSFPTAIITGEIFSFKANFTNTGASTLAVNGLTAKNIFKQSGVGPVALTGGEIKSGQLVSVAYDGTQYQIISDRPPDGSTLVKASGALVTHTGTTSPTTVATITIPAGSLGTNGYWELRLDVQHSNSAAADTALVNFDGTTLMTVVMTTVPEQVGRITVANRNSASSQLADRQIASTGGASFVVGITSSINTALAKDVTIVFTLVSGADTMELRSYSLKSYYAP